MEVRFTKTAKGRGCAWEALRPPRSRVPGPTMAAGGDLPHDLATFVIEQALGLEHGFWGCVAEGATFRSLNRKRTPQGKAVIDRHRAELDRAEALANEIHFGWRRGEPTPVSAELDEMLERWRALPEGESIVLTWSPRRSPRSRWQPRFEGTRASR